MIIKNKDSEPVCYNPLSQLVLCDTSQKEEVLAGTPQLIAGLSLPLVGPWCSERAPEQVCGQPPLPCASHPRGQLWPRQLLAGPAEPLPALPPSTQSHPTPTVATACPGPGAPHLLGGFSPQNTGSFCHSRTHSFTKGPLCTVPHQPDNPACTCQQAPQSSPRVMGPLFTSAHNFHRLPATSSAWCGRPCTAWSLAASSTTGVPGAPERGI